MNFEQWFKDYHSNNEAYAEQIARDAYQAGQEAQQARINEALSVLKGRSIGEVSKAIRILKNEG